MLEDENAMPNIRVGIMKIKRVCLGGVVCNF